jgi:hypothetical protein
MLHCILKVNYHRKGNNADRDGNCPVKLNPTRASIRPSGSIQSGIRTSGTTGGVSKNRHNSHNISTRLQLFSYLLILLRLVKLLSIFKLIHLTFIRCNEIKLR